MIEAVNSSVANAQVLRGNAGQSGASSAKAVSPPPAPVAVNEIREAPKAPYISPYISIDTKSNKAVLQIRDADTGEVEQQFPTKSRLAQLSQMQARHENSQKVRGAGIPSSDTENTEKQVVGNIITVQDITSSEPSNATLPTPQVAAAALSAGAQSGQSFNPNSSVSVFA